MSIIDACFEKYLMARPAHALTPADRVKLFRSGLLQPVDPKTRVNESDYMNKKKMIQRMEQRAQAKA